jgi:DNA modification methylase
MRWCIESLKLAPDSLVADPFMGSGSTGIAALALGHRFVGCEIDEGHFEIACKRLTEAQQQMGLLLEAA